jgi:hypothetical protein
MYLFDNYIIKNITHFSYMYGVCVDFYMNDTTCHVAVMKKIHFFKMWQNCLLNNGYETILQTIPLRFDRLET